MTKYNDIEMDKKLRSALFRTENKQIVFDSESPNDLRFEIRRKTWRRSLACSSEHRGADCPRPRITDRDCASSEDGYSQTKLTCQERNALCDIVHQRRRLFADEAHVPGACPSESSNRSMCWCHCRFWKRESQ